MVNKTEQETETTNSQLDTEVKSESLENTSVPTTDAFGQPIHLPLAEMSAAEKFSATKRLLFVAPDVPPVPPRPRRSGFRKLDDVLGSILTKTQDADFEQKKFERNEERSRNRGDSQAADDEESETGNRRKHRRGDARDQRNEEKTQVSEPQKVKGSTRLEAKKQRRRENRDQGRRRLVVTESEFLARREAVDRRMVVNTKQDRIQIGVLEDKVLVEHYVARSSEASIIGNVYLGRVQNVLPSMEAAFVDIGRGRNAVLYSGEVDWSDYSGSNNSRKIEKVLNPGDTVLVQVTKDPVGHKGARLTSQISLPGRFLVYVPGGAMNGISRKLPDTERARLKKILKEIVPDGSGVIVRTAAEGATEEQLTRDVQHLTKQWEEIQARVAKGGGPAVLHSEPDMLIKIIRDVFNEDFEELIISGAETHSTIAGYLEQLAPDLLSRVTLYDGERDVFDKYRITEQIQKALERKVWLPSGGSLVIDRTEAMTVIDVNTGKFVGSGGNLEETVTKNNLEAAEEIVRQLRLRDIGGIVVIDFIDMVLESNRDLVLRRLVECLGRDRTKHQVAEVTSLGLVQMTRKKLGLGLLETFSEPCEVCAGRGVIVQHDPVQHRKQDNQARRRNGSNGNNKSAQNSSETKAHALTEGAKTMIAQIAASTISQTSDAQDQAEAQTDAVAAEQSSDAAGQGKEQAKQTETSQPVQKKRRAKRVEKSDNLIDDLVADVQQLEEHKSSRKSVRADADLATLDAIFEALPEPPAPGTRSRRVSRRLSRPADSAE